MDKNVTRYFSTISITDNARGVLVTDEEIERDLWSRYQPKCVDYKTRAEYARRYYREQYGQGGRRIYRKIQTPNEKIPVAFNPESTCAGTCAAARGPRPGRRRKKVDMHGEGT